jgi:hypothetical protein
MPNRAASVIRQQRKLLARFNAVSQYLDGVGAAMWLPGVGQTFERPVRPTRGFAARGVRPVLLTLEVRDDVLALTGAVSRLRNGKMHYERIFDYDFNLVMLPRGGRRVLPANNYVLARRANELLATLVNCGREVARGLSPEINRLSFPRLIRDAETGGGIVAEDYGDLLGLPVANPLATSSDVELTLPNPAEKVFARAGLSREDFDRVDQGTVDALVAEFRGLIGDQFSAHVADEDVYAAFVAPHLPLRARMPVEEALNLDENAVVALMRSLLPIRWRTIARKDDLLCAARGMLPTVRMTRLSRLQLFDAYLSAELPEGFSGTPLRVASAPLVSALPV